MNKKVERARRDLRGAFITAQGKRCAICGMHDIAAPKGLVLDHDHETGKVRGALCGYCNTALGMFKDNPTNLKAAYDYLCRDYAVNPDYPV